MKFELQVHGGFTGLSRNYSGELDLSAEEVSMLNELTMPDSKNDTGYRDQESYRITLKDETDTIRLHFTERELTPLLRELLRKMKNPGN